MKNRTLNAAFLESDNWYSTPATEDEYNNFKEMVRFFVNQLKINNHLIKGKPLAVRSRSEKSTELIEKWNKFNGFKLSCRFGSGYQQNQNYLNYLNYERVNLNAIFDEKDCVSLCIGIKLDTEKKTNDNVLDEGEKKYSVADLDLDSDDPANKVVKAMFDELREQIYKWQEGKFTAMTQEKIRFETPYKNSENRIVFGAPGTGKSHTLNEDVQKLVKERKASFERVTFHPEYSYSSFVGCYKPVSTETDGIKYEYVAGPFMRVLVDAYKSGRTEQPRPHILLIEELNRARVAAVFGEVFQLLDRDDTGKSEYGIAPSEDVKKYLFSKLGGDMSDYDTIYIPNNMFIWATMNSADQGVFPIDTAFKRRWKFEYIGIDDNDKKVKSIIKIGDSVYDWNKLRKAINAKMSDLKINEDKLLGPYFIRKQYFNTDKNNNDANKDFVAMVKDKVLMYLFEDACKQKAKDMFEGCDYSRYSRIRDAFDEKGIEIFGKAFKTEYYDKEK